MKLKRLLDEKKLKNQQDTQKRGAALDPVVTELETAGVEYSRSVDGLHVYIEVDFYGVISISARSTKDYRLFVGTIETGEMSFDQLLEQLAEYLS